MDTCDAIVVGGGLVGSAIAYGLVRQGRSVLVLDEGDIAYRASRGNFGLVWVQGKGATLPSYAAWTMRSAEGWPQLSDELVAETGVDPELAQPGGVRFFLSREERDHRAQVMAQVAKGVGRPYAYEFLDHNEVRELVPDVGEAVVGACYSPLDGAANPLRLLQGLHAALLKRGVRIASGTPVERVERIGEGFEVTAANGEHYGAGIVVLAAGTGTARLGAMVGLDVPVRPQRGQIMVTARVRPFLSMPTHTLRQTADGGVLIGDSLEEAGFDDRSTPRVMAAIARRAVLTFPALKDAPVTRSWAALRVMTPDGYPVYQASESHPGAFVACVHSGVTLAAVHAGPLAEALAEGRLPQDVAPFGTERFRVRAA